MAEQNNNIVGLKLFNRKRIICGRKSAKIFNIAKSINLVVFKELDGRAVSVLGVRSRKLSTGLNGQS
jgi:hypothetical protein